MRKKYTNYLFEAWVTLPYIDDALTSYRFSVITYLLQVRPSWKIKNFLMLDTVLEYTFLGTIKLNIKLGLLETLINK